jgi:hypothetical protein
MQSDIFILAVLLCEKPVNIRWQACKCIYCENKTMKGGAEMERKIFLIVVVLVVGFVFLGATGCSLKDLLDLLPIK